MAVAFLSDEWLHALDGALRAAGGLAALGPFVLEQVVTDVPDRGEVRYCVVVDDAGARIGDGAHADVRLTTDYPTAVEIATGRGNAQRALATGRLRIGGDLDAFATRSSVLAAVSDAGAALRHDTVFPES